MRKALAGVLAGCFLLGGVAWAQDKPSEEERRNAEIQVIIMERDYLRARLVDMTTAVMNLSKQVAEKDKALLECQKPQDEVKDGGVTQ
uniref:Uncharacterized protein n=1 Tax=viral metagenome TaxID=1070528 RepID=A0A6M3KJC6_9ZZZZ